MGKCLSLKSPNRLPANRLSDSLFFLRKFVYQINRAQLLGRLQLQGDYAIHFFWLRIR